MLNPIFTIITPSFNQGQYIERTIKSVLSQGIPELEYLIFDGGSKDETVSVLKSFGNSISWVSEKDFGQADAVNKGLKIARGEIIGWLNSDDIYYPNVLSTVIDIFKNKEIDVIYGMADHIDENENIIEPYYTQHWDYEILKNVCFICQPAVFFRRSIIEKYGMLNDKLRYCMDYEYWLRIGKDKPFYYLQEKIAGSRLYPETKTLGSKVAVHEEILLMFKEIFHYIPSRWIYNYVHALLDNSGFKRDLPRENLIYVNKMIRLCLMNFLKFKHYIPMSDIKLMTGWYTNALKRSRETRTV